MTYYKPFPKYVIMLSIASRTKRRVDNPSEEKTRDTIRREAAIVIQCCIRVYLARKHVNEVMEVVKLQVTVV